MAAQPSNINHRAGYFAEVRARLLAEERENAIDLEEEDELLREVTVDELDEQLSKEKEEYDLKVCLRRAKYKPASS